MQIREDQKECDEKLTRQVSCDRSPPRGWCSLKCVQREEEACKEAERRRLEADAKTGLGLKASEPAKGAASIVT